MFTLGADVVIVSATVSVASLSKQTLKYFVTRVLQWAMDGKINNISKWRMYFGHLWESEDYKAVA